jgi:hypothetical protein
MAPRPGKEKARRVRPALRRMRFPSFGHGNMVNTHIEWLDFWDATSHSVQPHAKLALAFQRANNLLGTRMFGL